MVNRRNSVNANVLLQIRLNRTGNATRQGNRNIENTNTTRLAVSDYHLQALLHCAVSLNVTLRNWKYHNCDSLKMNPFHAVKLQTTACQQIEASVWGLAGNEATALLMSEAQFDAFNKSLDSSDRDPWCEMTQSIDLTPTNPSQAITPPNPGTWHVVLHFSHDGFFRARAIEP